MPAPPRPSLLALGALALASVGLVACGGGAAAAGNAGLAVAATDTTCVPSATSVPAGVRTIDIHNAGRQVTELYVYAPGDKAVGEVENVGPGLTRHLTVNLPAGTFELACRPGMTGHGVRSTLTVTPAGSTAPVDPAVAQAIASYQAGVEQTAAELVAATTPFVAAVKAGDVARAKELYAAARLPYERIEPIGESLGDLDPRIDDRETDVGPGTTFTGFHRLERDLWTGSIAADGPIADQLLADVTELRTTVAGLHLTVDQIGNGAKSLLDEVARTKVTGEEERYSHIDLVDFAGNVAGAEAAVAALRPVLAARQPALLQQLDTRFRAVDAALAPYGSGSSFVPYTTLTPDQVKQLATLIDAVAEPVSRVTAAVVG
ncbi:MAG TPA: iron uptake system protein EfeO [Frankiaceae bacterium]